MAIFRRYLAENWPTLPTIMRRMATNVLNITFQQYNVALDAVAESLVQFLDTSYPLLTASGWMLDEHWGPYVNVNRNGGSDDQYRLFIRAKRLLNREWGAADQALTLFALLIPAATLSITIQYPKSWTINIGGVPIADTLEAIAFMAKKPSPFGGGFSVCGDNGLATAVDAEAFNYGSVYGVMGVDYQVTGWFTSIYGDPGSAVAGYAHVAEI